MDLSETIYIHARALPLELQREALDFIDALARQHPSAAMRSKPDTETFIRQFAGSIGADFPNEIDEHDLPADIPREALA